MANAAKSITQKPHAPEKDKFKIPSWAGMPPHGAHLDCIKGDRLVQKLFIDELSYFYFGRNVELCEIPVEHASCSRVHAVLVYHKQLQRFALIDLNSSHGSFVSDVRIAPLTPIFMDVGTKFFFGASTRRFVIREKYEAKVESNDTANGEKAAPPKPILPEDEEELDHLTEYNTAQNRRIPVIPQSDDEAKEKKKPRSKVTFDEEEVIYDLDDPNQGRFQNLVQTVVIPRKRKLDDVMPQFPYIANRPRVSLRKLTGDAPDMTEYSSILGMRMNAAPDVDQLTYGPAPAEEEPHHKKYVKEVWPGRKPTTALS